MATHSRILAWRIPGQRRLIGDSPQSCKVLDTSVLSECNLRYPLTTGSRIPVAESDSVYLLLPRICVGQGDPVFSGCYPA